MQTGVERLISEAQSNRSKIILRSGESFYEGQVERIYENRVIKFCTGSGRHARTGYFLLADVDEVFNCQNW